MSSQKPHPRIFNRSLLCMRYGNGFWWDRTRFPFLKFRGYWYTFDFV